MVLSHHVDPLQEQQVLLTAQLSFESQNVTMLPRTPWLTQFSWLNLQITGTHYCTYFCFLNNVL